MTKKKKEKLLSNDEVAEIVDTEGLGYAVQDYLSGDLIKDPQLRTLWNNAAQHLREIELYLMSKE